MRGMASTVTIVTTAFNGRYHGMTATAVTSVSMSPPSLLVAVNRSASIHSPLVGRRQFCVNLLSEQHAGECQDFSGRKQGIERFSSGKWSEWSGMPYLEDAKANLFCDLDGTIDYGTHTICLGRVIELLQHGDGTPLVYLAGDFLPIGQSPA